MKRKSGNFKKETLLPLTQNDCSEELAIANKKIDFQNIEKEKQASELVIANEKLDFEYEEKEKRAAELMVANVELSFQNTEKENRASELLIANKELVFQKKEKEKRASELVIANDEKNKRAAELIIANKELIYQNEEKELRVTELRVTKKKLLKNEKRYHALIENCTDGIIIFTSEGKPKYVSSTVKKNLGYTEEEIMQIDLFNILHVKDIPFLQDVMQQVLDNPGMPIKAHTGRMLHKDGTWRWIEATITNMLHDPTIMGIVGNFHDVTEKKRVEQKLVFSNRLYAFISQINQTIVHVKDEQILFETACRIAIEYGKFKIAWIGIADTKNRRIRQIATCGGSASDILLLSDYTYDEGGPIESVLNGLSYYVINDYRKEEDVSMSKYLLERGIYSGITLSIRKRGSVIGVFTVYSSEIDFFNTSEIALIEEVIRDISFALDVLENAKLKLLADAKLKKSESNLQVIFENASEGFILTDINGIINTFNNKSNEIALLNVEKELKIGNSVFDYIRENRKEKYKDIVLKALTGNTQQYDYSLKRKNGESKWFCFTVNPVFNAEEITGLSITTVDITEKKKAEILLAQSQFNLKAIIENTDASIYSLDRDLNFITFNELFQKNIQEYYGFKLKAGDHITKVLKNLEQEEAAHWEKTYARAIEGHIIKFEREFNFKNIQHFISFSIHPILENKKVIGLSCFTLDVTKDKQAKKNLLALNHQLRNLSSYLETVREDERTNIAREVHDELGQQMTRLKMDIAWLNTNIKDKRPEVIQRILTMMNMVAEGIKAIRRIVIQLRPSILDDLGLEAAIEWLAKEFEKNTGLPCLLNSSLKYEKFSSQVNTTVFRIFQESLTNITRYAKASQVNASLYEEDNELVLDVIDNGIGIIDERKDNITSFGLLGMRERAAILKGSFTIEKMPKRGTKVQLKIPI